MDDIAKEADVSRTTLFNYFSGKGEILDHLTAEMLEGFYLRIEASRASTRDVRKRIMNAFVFTGEVMESMAEDLRPLVGYFEQSWNDAGVLERMERLTSSFESLLVDGDMEFSADAPDRRAMAEIMSGVFVGMVHTWRVSPDYPLKARMTEAARWICLTLERSSEVKA